MFLKTIIFIFLVFIYRNITLYPLIILFILTSETNKGVGKKKLYKIAEVKVKEYINWKQ